MQELGRFLISRFSRLLARNTMCATQHCWVTNVRNLRPKHRGFPAQFKIGTGFAPELCRANPLEHRAMIVLTDSAAEAVRTALRKADAATAGLRIQVETGGCAGYKYQMGLVSSPDENDAVVTAGDVAIYIDPASQPLLEGATIDFVVALEGSGFTFDNPNASNRCSCGKSFG
jgi:iron-sulfur cluster assembly protein